MIHVVIGTKAQLIKMAPILKLMKMKNIYYNYISTGQHKATIDDILQNFDIKKPDYELYSGEDITSVSKMIMWSLKIVWHTLFNKRKIFRNDRNGMVLVHGDTFSTFIGAVMGKIGRLKVGHVESGLRSYNIWQPFPEELTRLIVFALSDYLFCPGEWAQNNLLKYEGRKINTKANTLSDSISFALPAIEQISDLNIPSQEYGIVTLHRFENFRNTEAALKVVKAVEIIAKSKLVLFILHKSSEINLYKYSLYERLKSNPNIELRQRYDYFKFIKLIIHASFVVSDGGSNQEECYYLGKPLLLLRNITERNEGLRHNAVLSEFNLDIIQNFLDNLETYRHPMLRLEKSPSEEIIRACMEFSY
ncbi:MAG: UDP-N-acetylglucosamine 2-epimerase [Anaerolineaceae bacterium]